MDKYLKVINDFIEYKWNPLPAYFKAGFFIVVGFVIGLGV